MESKWKLPTALIGGSLAGYAVSTPSSYVVNKALINKVGVKAEEFKSTLNAKQFAIYKNILSRTTDIERLRSNSVEVEVIRKELKTLKKELEKTLSPKQRKVYNSINKIEKEIAKRVGYTTVATTSLGAIIGLAIAKINSRKK